MEIERGSIVKSMMGRDAGRIFVVMEVIDDEYLSLADGKVRPLERAKKKKKKHVQFFAQAQTSRVIEKLHRGDKVLNSELRRLLKEVSECE